MKGSLIISKNISLMENPNFGTFDMDVVGNLISNVDVVFSKCLEIEPFSSKECVIMYNQDEPMCCNSSAGRIIFLATKENYWCQWIYQFAHEYCHHLIDGKMIPNFNGLFWFEETICELASLFHLSRMGEYCFQSPKLTHYAQSVALYLSDLLTKNNNLVESFRLTKLQPWREQLQEKVYHRDLYNAIAVVMFPYFERNPHLWKIIRNFGDMKEWTSLEGLFTHLEEQATPDYIQSLKQLKTCLL